jgi:hypothetical protein
MQISRSLRSKLSFLLLLPLSVGVLQAQDKPERHGRKYKAPPPSAHIEVQVTKHFNGKPIMNAAVVLNPFDKDGHDLGSLEVKTDPEGKAAIDVIPQGSRVLVQVIADGYATYAANYQIDDPTAEIEVALLRPQEQVSSYVDNEGKASSRKAGVQEPIRPKQIPAAKPASSSDKPADQSAPSNSTQSAPKQQ